MKEKKANFTGTLTTKSGTEDSAGSALSPPSSSGVATKAGFLTRSTKIKFALFLTALSSIFLGFGFLDGDDWVGFQVWIYTAFAIANVVSPLAHASANVMSPLDPAKADQSS